MTRPIVYDSPDIFTESNQRQIGALETSTAEQFVSIRTVAGEADSSFTFGGRASRPAGGAEGDRFWASDIGARGGALYVWNGVAWELIVGVASGTNAERAAYTPDATDNGLLFWTTDTCKLWEVAGGAWVDRFVSPDATTSYEVAGVKVVGAQGAAVADVASADATDLATVITLANETKAQLNILLARARSHGLITT